MKTADARSLMLALRACLDEDDGEQNARRLAEYVVEMATSGHFGYFLFLLNAVDGKLLPTAEEESTFEAGCVIVITLPRQAAGRARAA
jgi:hypothetical protein